MRKSTNHGQVKSSLYRWDMTIIDAAPGVVELSSCGAGDIDGDGIAEMVTGGAGGLLWYRPATGEKGKISDGVFVVGLTIADLDNDGIPEIVAGEKYHDRNEFSLSLFKLARTETTKWEKYVVDERCTGSTHDLVACDVDGDGELELIANAAYCHVWGLFIYKRNGPIVYPWKRVPVQQGYAEEGLDAVDLNGDGKIEIVSGVAWYEYRGKNPFSGKWVRHEYAHDFREMVRVACVDITGNGRPDIVTLESEFVDGKLSWFENRIKEDSENSFIEHPIDYNLNFVHSLQVEKIGRKKVSIFCAEMAAGGWEQPYNRDARVMEYFTSDAGKTWRKNVLYQGCGTHQALKYDIDGDGEREVIGKIWGMHVNLQRVQVYKKRNTSSPIDGWQHRFIDREKPYTSIEIVAADVDDDGREDVVTGAWWYKNPHWQRFDIPGIAQVINAYDLDGDGRKELIAVKGNGLEHRGFYENLNSNLVWLKPLDPTHGKWAEYPIGVGSGDWPHGSVVGPFGSEGRTAVIVTYHSCGEGRPDHYPEIFEMQAGDYHQLWPKITLAPIPYGEEMIAFDFDEDGKLEIAAGPFLLKKIDNKWQWQKIIDDFEVARLAVIRMPSYPLPHLVMGAEQLDYKQRHVPFSPLIWLKNPGKWGQRWEPNVIDKVLCPHSVGVLDVDGDGEEEILCGEHFPFKPYRSRSEFYVYKRAHGSGSQWTRYTLDSRFEHHNSLKTVKIDKKKKGIVGIGWTEERYVHLWYRSE